MVDGPPHDAVRTVTRILSAVNETRSASADLLPLVYADLRRLAAARMTRLAPGQTLQATALVHEAYMRLVGDNHPGWQGRAHFFGAAARAMRNVVADSLQQKGTLKRGGDRRRVGEQTAAELTCDGPGADLLVVEEALGALEREYPRKAEIVTLRFYGGLDHDEVAEVLGVSVRIVGSVSSAAGPIGGQVELYVLHLNGTAVDPVRTQQIWLGTTATTGAVRARDAG
jgi:RNA polymerase sigma factor (TIGR02999 family)